MVWYHSGGYQFARSSLWFWGNTELRHGSQAISGSNRRELKSPRGDASVLRGESSPVRRPGRRRRRCKGGMVMEAPPTSSLKVPQPELLFEFLVVPLDAPAQLRERDQAV